MSDVIGDPALALSFKVEVDVDKSLGVFTACDGLSCEVVVERREEGGNNSFIHQLPVRITYQNIKLKRPINEDSGKVAKWFASMSGDIRPTNAHIVAMRADGTEVASWSLQGVIPVKWQGPSLDVESNKVAVETLELAHNGFLDGAP